MATIASTRTNSHFQTGAILCIENLPVVFRPRAIFESLSCNLQLAISSALFCGCLLFHLAGTWVLPLVDRDEPRFAEASREMIERGDYVVPYFNNRYRFDKPPLTYWCQVASFRVFGENPFAARFPSARRGGADGGRHFCLGTAARSRSRRVLGQRSSSRFACRLSSMPKPRSPTCGWCFS